MESPDRPQVNRRRSGADVESARGRFDGSWLEVLGVLTTFATNVEKLKLYKASLSLIKFFSILNLTYSMIGVAFFILAYFPTSHLRFTDAQREHFVKLGLFISIFSPLALCTDLLALRGLRRWKRKLLLPWIILYALLITLSFSVAVTQTFHRGIHWQLVLLALCSLCIFSGWRHVRIQYTFMGFDSCKPTEARTIQALTDEIRVAVNTYETANETTSTAATSLPPKYEDLEHPPKYEDKVVEKPFVVSGSFHGDDGKI